MMPATSYAIRVSILMSFKYPQSGETYDSAMYPGSQCVVVRVIDAQVTFRWLGRFSNIPEQEVPVNQFLRDFTLNTPGTHGE